MKNLLLVLVLLSSKLSAVPSADSKAYAIQYLIKDDGSIIATETILDTKTGSFTSVPLEGLLALFELWVYPFIGEDGGEATPQLMDSEIVGVLPNIDINFTGIDPYEHARTRADWDHQIEVVIHEPIGELEDGQSTPDWMRSFLVRKRFLSEEFIGTEDAADHWQEYDSLPLYHNGSNQIENFSDSAYPPGLEDSDSWSGIIEYQVVADAVIGSPIPYLQIATQQVRVWPKWDVEFQNFPADPVTSVPSNLETYVTDIYPGTEKVEIEYLFRSNEDESFDSVEPVTIFAEPWTAVTAQDRQYSLAAIANLDEAGEYFVRVSFHYPWGVEYSYEDVESIDEDTAITSFRPVIEVGSHGLIFRGGLHSLE